MKLTDQHLKGNPDRDFEVRCPIHGAVSFNGREKKLINHPFFQRLRHVSQLGFGSYVYPGAVHTRFSHSLGAMHLAGSIFDRLIEHSYPRFSSCFSLEEIQYFRQIIRFAALLHDVGHPPFSHVLEVILPHLSQLNLDFSVKPPSDRQADHEDYSLAVVNHLSKSDDSLLTQEESSDIIAILSGNQPENGKLSTTEKGVSIFPLLVQLISGEMDVDRMDYLLRDAYYAGVTYGRFDLNRLIRSFTCMLNENTGNIHLVLAGSGIPAYENFLLARSNMFVQVYFHKSLPALGYFLEQAFKTGELQMEIDGSMSQFLKLTEHQVYEALHKASDKPWSARILNRDMAKVLVRWVSPGESQVELGEVIHNYLLENEIHSICSRPFNYFSAQTNLSEGSPKSILVTQSEFAKTRVLPLNQASHLLKVSPEKIEIFQLSALPEEYDNALGLIQKRFKNQI